MTFFDVRAHCTLMFADINGIRMSYEDSGSGEPIVLIGGFGANGAFWSNAVPMMDGYRVITFDNRGVGDTVYDGGFSLEDLADDVVALLDHLGLDRVHVLGWSMGSQVAQLLGIHHPDRLKSLTLVSTYLRRPARFEYIMSGMNDMVLKGVAPIDALAMVVNAFCFTEDLFMEYEASGCTFPIPEKPERPEGLRDQLRAIDGCDTTDEVSGIRVPTMVIHGGKDIMVEPREGVRVAESIPGSRLLLLDSAGHNIPFEMYWDSLRGFIGSNM